jgi:hypothetical protein
MGQNGAASVHAAERRGVYAELVDGGRQLLVWVVRIAAAFAVCVVFLFYVAYLLGHTPD